MNDYLSTRGCTGCAIDRRRFLSSACAACVGTASAIAPSALRATPAARKLRIRVIYSLHAVKQPGPDWPNKGFDFGPVMERVNSALKKGCPEYEFVPTTANGPDQAKRIVEQDRTAAIDGYVVYQMNCWNRVIQTVAATGKPVLYADFQYGGSGGFLVYNAAFLRQKSGNVGFVASSSINDLVAAVKCFDVVAKRTPNQFAAATTRVRVARTRTTTNSACPPDELTALSPEECLRKMKESKILAIRGQNSGPAPAVMGIPLVYVSFAELDAAWNAADRDESRVIVDRWQKTATKIAGVSRETLEDSAAMYLGMKALLEKHDANAITINCLGGFYGGHIHAYPCLGHHELLNEGLVGACECDVRSTATMVAVTALSQGRPGYISDPVIDTSKRQIIYAHCVATNRVDGPSGEASPFEILTHSEDRQGASLRAILPLGRMTTTLEFAQEKKEILLHRAKTVENTADDRACRTKIAAEPIGDIEKLFTEWDRWSWHRVTYYGDLEKPVRGLADALGWKVVEEA